tara:strand:- start:260 stop:463 length:204 start_codon:yes stop_codon:yes gene_type:complete
MKEKQMVDLAIEILQSMQDGVGVCHACGEEASGVNGWAEPDARRYECECCGERAVYGAEETLVMLAG